MIIKINNKSLELNGYSLSSIKLNYCCYCKENNKIKINDKTTIVCRTSSGRIRNLCDKCLNDYESDVTILTLEELFVLRIAMETEK